MKKNQTHQVKKPDILLVMPGYNVDLFIREAIDSIFDQTFSDFEFVIIDDGSDDTWKITQSYKDKRIVSLQNSQKTGNYSVENKGLLVAWGKYMAIMGRYYVAMLKRQEKQFKQLEANVKVLAVESRYIFYPDKRIDIDLFVYDFVVKRLLH